MRTMRQLVLVACVLLGGAAWVAAGGAREPAPVDPKAEAAAAEEAAGKKAASEKEPVREKAPSTKPDDPKEAADPVRTPAPATRTKQPADPGKAAPTRSRTAPQSGSSTDPEPEPRAPEPAPEAESESQPEPEPTPEPTPVVLEPMAPELQQEILAAHNAARASASPTPSPALPPLTWNADLAAKAQEWANSCPSGHRPNRHIDAPGTSGLMGENMAWNSSATYSPTAAVDVWAAEAPNFDYAANQCTPSGQCFHYTQVVWRNSTQLGCGMRTGCTSGPLPTVYVCNYFPAGNFNMSENKPY